MAIRGESDACFKTSNHYECRLIGCKCTCHERGPAPVWDPTVQTRTTCSGTTWTADRNSAA